MEIHQQNFFHPIALCGPVYVLLSAEPSACMCVCLNLSMYKYPFSCHVSNIGLFHLPTFYTLSETPYHWRKTEPVTMRANFIHFWWVESEFMIKNWFHNWTSELGCIWHIFGKFRLFLALFGKSWYSSNCQHHCQQGSVYLQQLVVASAEVLEKSQIFQKCAKCTLNLMSKYKINFLL